MFTQCPECGTVFRVTATVLRAAQGQVRCGVCDANFDALRFLTDAVDGEVPAQDPAAEPPRSPPSPPPVAARAPPAPPAAAPPPPPPTQGSPPLAPRRSAPATRTTPSVDEGRALAEIAAALAHDAELSRQRAALKARLEPAAPAEDDVNVLEPTDVENIVLGGESGASEASTEAALEFNVPPGQWDRVFVAEDGTDTITPLDINLGDLEDLPQAEARAAEQPLSLIDAPLPEPATAKGRVGRAVAAAEDLRLADEDPLSRTDEYAMLELAELKSGSTPATLAASTEPELEPEPEPEPDSEPEVEVEAGSDDGAINIEDAWFDPGHGNNPIEPRAAEPVRARAPLAEYPPFVPPPDESGLVVEEPPAPRRHWRAAAATGAVVLALLLLVQLVHHNRDALGSMDGIGAPLAALYARLGMPLEPHWDLGSYDVKQWGAATDNAPGSLRLRASLVNRAQRAQPYPLLRVTLEDRFGAKVARREFTPAEYLPGRTAPAQLLAPGARADADLSLADPGSEAVGFELDVCLKRAGILNCGTEPKAAAGGG